LSIWASLNRYIKGRHGVTPTEVAGARQLELETKQPEFKKADQIVGQETKFEFDEKGEDMKLAKWMIAIFTGALSLGALLGVAAAQIAFENLPKVLDASMPRDQQISIALSAGPSEIRDKATVYILGPKGFEKAREGTNGVSCLVSRHFATPTETTIEPMCYDAEGSQTLLLADLYKEELRSKGMSEADIKSEIANGYKTGRFKAPSKPGIRYMLSSDNRLGPTPDHKTVHVPGHFMFYAPYMTGKDLGFDSDSAAAFLVEAGRPEATIIVFPDQKLM
jgi:hypothetical protein